MQFILLSDCFLAQDSIKVPTLFHSFNTVKDRHYIHLHHIALGLSPATDPILDKDDRQLWNAQNN